jgi:ribosomal protein L16 Arg81 hydroxylase
MATETEPTARTATEPTATIRTEPTPPSADRAERFTHLARLIGAEAVAGFLHERLGVDAWRTRIDPQAARALFGWDHLNAALAEHRLAHPRLRLERAGGDVTKGLFRSRRTRQGAVLYDLDAGVLNARLREGATLIVDAVNELNPPLQRLCAGLAAEFGAACQTNLYACWGETQGFDVHWDDHDVFVLQVEGRKRWALYGATRAAPTRRDLHGEHLKPEVPLEEVVLEPGDLLYLPRGYWHAAVGLGEPTLHLTIGLTRKTGADFLHWLADEALAEAAVRTDLPLERDDATLAAWIGGLLASLSSREPEALAEAYRRHVEGSQAQRPALSFPSIGDDRSLASGVRIGLAAGAAHVRREEAAVVLRWRGVDHRIAQELEAPIRALAAGALLTVEGFEAAVSLGLRPLVRPFLAEMIGRGVFVARPEADA